ncbi:MAG: hypothetical protein ABSA75_05365 [Candidatus Bathyarchaeia archaeon]|jgi:hypothetical protein
MQSFVWCKETIECQENIEKLSNIVDAKLNVWLAEYDACHQNRNHLDTARWLIGSIFIVASFTILGFSFQDNIAKNIVYVLTLTFISIFLMLIWAFYNWTVQRYIDITYKRMWKLEENIRALKLDIQLHTSIKKDVPEGKGLQLFIITVDGFFIFCAIRIALFFV